VFQEHADFSLVKDHKCYTPDVYRGRSILVRKPHINGSQQNKIHATINCQDKIKTQLTGHD
jgi:hypothetical protein